MKDSLYMSENYPSSMHSKSILGALLLCLLTLPVIAAVAVSPSVTLNVSPAVSGPTGPINISGNINVVALDVLFVVSNTNPSNYYTIFLSVPLGTMKCGGSLGFFTHYTPPCTYNINFAPTLFPLAAGGYTVEVYVGYTYSGSAAPRPATITSYEATASAPLTIVG